MSNKSKATAKSSTNTIKEEICISLLGSMGVGKSALMVKYITKRFIGEYDPYYEGCWTKYENVDGIDLVVQIYDTYDKEKKNIEKYIKWSDYLILCYSVTNYQSFLEAQEYFDCIHETVKNIHDEIISNSGSSSANSRNNSLPVKVLLLGNKIDLGCNRQVNKQEVDAFVDKCSSSNSQVCEPLINIRHMETTSCEDFALVQNVFHSIVREVRQDRNSISNPLHITEDTSTLMKPKTSGLAASIVNKRSRSPKPNDASAQHGSPSSNMRNSLASISISNSPNGSSMCTSPPSANSTTCTGNNSNVNSFLVANPNGKEIGKKNSSKFPFFNKILNKS